MLNLIESVIALLVSAFCSYYLYAMINPRAMYVFLSLLGLAILGSVALLRRYRFHSIDALACFMLTMIVWMVSPASIEGFKGKKKGKQTPKPQDDDEDEEEDGLDMESESRKNPTKGSKKEDFGEAHVDLGSTFLKAYSKLNPDQVGNMRKDTKELMETQKQLMDTLTNMGPAVQQGVELIENFKKYFSGGVGGGLMGDLGSPPVPPA